MNRSYPIGNFKKSEFYTTEEVADNITEIARLPELLQAEVAGLAKHDFQKTYREGSWTVAQLVHHIPDSHVNGYIRTKWALTEDNPTIKPYNENAWSQTADISLEHLSLSVNMLHALHSKWVSLLTTLTEDQLRRTYYHPVNKTTSSLADLIALYAWHGNHHLAHIKLALNRPL